MNTSRVSRSACRSWTLLLLLVAVMIGGAAGEAATPSLIATETVTRSIETTRVKGGYKYAQRESWRIGVTVVLPVADSAAFAPAALETLFAKGGLSLSVGDCSFDAVVVASSVNRTKRTATLRVVNGGDETRPAGVLSLSWNETAFTITGTVGASAANFIAAEEPGAKVADTITGSASLVGNLSSGTEMAGRDWQAIKLSGTQSFKATQLRGQQFSVGVRSVTATSDAVPPTVKILSPATDVRKDGALVEDASISLSGYALDNREISSVVVKIDGGEETDADVVYATTPAGEDILSRANWSFDAGVLESGAHVFEVYAIDEEGLRSSVATRRIDYVKYANLQVAVDGGGTVTAAFLANNGVTRREVRRQYTITATPQPGYLFAGWSGDLDGLAFAQAALTFTMPDLPTVHLTARFVPNPLVGFEGEYSVSYGLGDDAAYADSLESFGSITFTMTSTGQVTGKLLTGRTPGGVSFQAAVDGDGTLSADVPFAPLTKGQTVASVPHLHLELSIDLSDSTQPQVSGRVFAIEPGSDDSLFERDVVGYRKAWSAAAPVDPAVRGGYTFVIETNEVDANDYNLPPGYAVARVAADGTFAMSGVLPDGATFNFTKVLSPDLAVFIFQPLANGVLVGKIALDPELDSATVSAALTVNYERYDEDDLQTVFDQKQLTVTAEEYVAPAAGESMMPFADGGGSITITTYYADGDDVYSRDLVKSFTVGADNAAIITDDNAEGVQLLFQPGQGTFIGSFNNPDSGRTETFGGALLQSESEGAGQYGAPGASGPVVLDFLAGDGQP